MSLNKVILIGHVGKSPEIRYLGEGRDYKVAKFTFATDEWYKDKEGRAREITVWHNISAWNATADYVEKYIKKGMQLYVEGALRYRTWTDSAGTVKSVCEIAAKDIRVLNWKNDVAPDASSDGQDRYEGGKPITSGEPEEDESIPDDGLPF